MEYIGHGDKEIVERIIPSPKDALEAIKGLKSVAVSDRVAGECINLGYGFFSPLQGFMDKADVQAVCGKMTLADGTLWSIPIVFDISKEEISQRGIEEGERILLAYRNKALAILEVENIFDYSKIEMMQTILGTIDTKHPGVRMYNDLADKFIGGKVTLVNTPKFNPPFRQFWHTPLGVRTRFTERGWERIVAHQTRNVPHTGHEWLMKGAWFSTNGNLPVERTRTGILVSCIIGAKRTGDYIDEAIVLSHQMLHDAHYFRDDTHMVSIVLWDMRYAGPKEAIFHAILRENLGCTHHMFGRDHAGVGSFYDPYDAHRIFDKIPDNSLRIKPVRILDWWYCPICQEVTYSGLCGHTKEKQEFSGTLIRSMIQDRVKPSTLIFRPEVFDAMMAAANSYGYGSPFCSKEYLKNRQPVFDLPVLE